MALTFPNSPANYRAFFEAISRAHPNVMHNPQAGIMRFWEINYLDFPYNDWDFEEWDKAVSSKISITGNEFPKQQGMAILSFETGDGKQEGFTVQASVLFFTKPRKNIKDAADYFVAKTECHQATYETALDVKKLIRAYFRSNAQGYLEPNTFRTINVRMPQTTNAMYGTRLDFTYGFYHNHKYTANNWAEDLLA